MAATNHRHVVGTNHRAAEDTRADLVWPLAVVGLLLLSIGASVTVMLASRIDGGAQVVGDYYSKAVAWDSVAAIRQASLALGWTVEVALEEGDSSRERSLTFAFRDRQGEPVDGLEGSIRLSRPQWASPVDEKPLERTAEPGVYRQAFTIDGAGLWDFEIDARLGESRFWSVVRKELM